MIQPIRPDLTDLKALLANAFEEVGLPLHQCYAGVPGYERGGVCLTRADSATPAGIIVTWHCDARLSRLTDRHADVQAAMNRALADVVRTFGYTVEPLGRGGAWIVTG